MRIWRILLIPALVFGLFTTISAQEDDQILSIYAGSDIRYDDRIGFEEYSFIVDEATVRTVEGILRRQFCRAPEGRSSLEILRNYERAVQDLGGTILFVSRDPTSIEIDGATFGDIFQQNRVNYGLATSHMTHTGFPRNVTEYLAAQVPVTGKDVYVIVAVGRGSRGPAEQNRTFFELITLEAEPMEMGMVSVEAISRGLAEQGRIAVYDILFDTGASEVRAESAPVLQVIAEFLNAHQNQKVIVVGHTDSVGDFDMNIALSTDRARAVVEKLASEYGVDRDQLRPYGVGPVAPVQSNATEEGRARNRRVEIVAQ